MVSGSFDQSQRSTTTSGATKKNTGLHFWVVWPQVACHAFEKESLMANSAARVKCANILEMNLAKMTKTKKKLKEKITDGGKLMQ